MTVDHSCPYQKKEKLAKLNAHRMYWVRMGSWKQTVTEIMSSLERMTKQSHIATVQVVGKSFDAVKYVDANADIIRAISSFRSVVNIFSLSTFETDFAQS